MQHPPDPMQPHAIFPPMQHDGRVRPWVQGRTGPQLVAGLPRFQGTLHQDFLGRPPADESQCDADSHDLPGLLTAVLGKQLAPHGAQAGLSYSVWAPLHVT